jgi:hypothetical protein
MLVLNDALLDRLQTVFTSDEQQLFLHSFYLYSKFAADEFAIDLDGQAWVDSHARLRLSH